MAKVVHPPLPIMNVLGYVLGTVRQDARLSLALDDYAERNPDAMNVQVRWLSQKYGYEVTLKFGNDPLELTDEQARNILVANEGLRALAEEDANSHSDTDA